MTNEVCKVSRCHWFDGFGCTRGDVVQPDDERCACDDNLQSDCKAAEG